MELSPLTTYKGVLKKLDKGFGYEGVVLQTEDGDKLQCHICGKLFSHLGSHSASKHKLTAKEYRKKFNLCYNTALVSNNQREKLIKAMMAIKEETRERWRKIGLEAFKKLDRKIFSTTKGKKFEMSLETKNKRGSCPDQILEKIQEVVDKEGKVPSMTDFRNNYRWGKRYLRLAERTFGSWSKALKKLNLEPASLSKPHRFNGRRWSKEELLDMLVEFRQSEGRTPSYSDTENGFLPHYSTYRKRFGSFEKARVLSGVYEVGT